MRLLVRCLCSFYPSDVVMFLLCELWLDAVDQMYHIDAHWQSTLDPIRTTAFDTSRRIDLNVSHLHFVAKPHRTCN